jgi:hypothetical protein
MSQPPSDAELERAALYALGALSPDEADGVVADAASGTGTDAVTAMREVAAALALGTPGPRPPSSLRARLLERVDRETYWFSLAADAAWETAGDGVAIRRLHPDRLAGRLVRLDAGASWLAASDGMEQWYVVSGAVVTDGEQLESGDARLIAASEPVRARVAAVAFVVPLGPADGRASESVRAGQPAPLSLGRGVEGRALGTDATGQVQCLWLTMAPGSAVFDHDHAGAEELFMLAGDCRCHGRVIGAGDYHRAEARSRHGVTSTVGGCTMLVVSRAA